MNPSIRSWTHIGWCLACMAIVGLWACAKDNDLSGVTSTGNAGEIAGIVMPEGNSALGRWSLAASTVQDKGLPHAWVYRIDERGIKQDSTLTDAFGLFAFDSVPEGVWTLKAVWEGETAELKGVELPFGKTLRTLLSLHGRSEILADSWLPPGLHSAASRVDTLQYGMSYVFDSLSLRLTVKRPSAGACGWSGGEAIEALWSVRRASLNLYLRNAAESSCPELEFFSTLPNDMNHNNWFLNGSLRALRDTLPSSCTEPLPGLPEMLAAGMETVTLHMEGGNLRAVFSALDWCLLRDARGLDSVPAGYTASVKDCITQEITPQSGVTGEPYTLEYKAINFMEPWSVRLRTSGGVSCLDRQGDEEFFEGCAWEAWPKPCP